MRKVLERLYNQHTLSSEEACSALLGIMRNEVNSSQVAALLSAFRMRPITLDEFCGFREALMQVARKVDFSSYNVLDLCGTGGDEKSTFNISTLSAVVVAACGIRVSKHGNSAVSSSCGSSNVLEHLGVRFTDDEARLRRQLEESGICFLHAPLFHPGMRFVAPVRKELGIKTFFNLLGPLVNPCDPVRQFAGVYNLEAMRLFSNASQRLNKQFTVVHSLDGYDEISLTARFRVVSPQGVKEWEPEDLGFERVMADEISATGGVAESAKLFMQILQGLGTKAQAQVISVNAGFAMHAARADDAKGVSLGDCIREADDAIRSGRALATFNKHLALQD